MHWIRFDCLPVRDEVFPLTRVPPFRSAPLGDSGRLEKSSLRERRAFGLHREANIEAVFQLKPYLEVSPIVGLVSRGELPQSGRFPRIDRRFSQILDDQFGVAGLKASQPHTFGSCALAPDDRAASRENGTEFT
jgi:hypothetical protein